MSTEIKSIDNNSPAFQAGLVAGDFIVSINGHRITDVLDYKFYSYDSHLKLEIKSGARTHIITIDKPEGLDLGIDFDTYLMDSQRGCSNKCIFCFIDQLPKNMRSTLYFKDDDARMSFLLGNYISMTNLSDDDVQRIISMRISPLNISVHTTNPGLRTKMLGNPRGGDSLRHLKSFYDAKLSLQCQIVVCPGYNDGAELSRTLRDLSCMAPAVSSIAVVPVGLSRHRENLTELRSVSKSDALDIIKRIDSARKVCEAENGNPLVFAADELYLKAGLSYPEPEYYCDYAQLENGVGMMSMFEQELNSALSMEEDNLPAPAEFTIATGVAAADFMQKMIDLIKSKCPELKCGIIVVQNNFFGAGVDVAGLLTGGDIINAARGKVCGKLLLPACTMKHGETVFLDDVTLADLSRELACSVETVEVDGAAFFDAIFN